MKLYEIAEGELGPIRKRYNELLREKNYIWEVLDKGSLKAREIAVKNLEEVRGIIGFR